MESDDDVARALNSFAKDAFAMMGGADAMALSEMLGEYMAIEAQPHSKSPTH